MGDQSNDQLLALLGEELKQPLVAIAQLAEIQSSEGIREQAKRALRTIDNVLLYRRVSSGQVSLRLEPVHVGSAMREVEQTMRPLMLQQGCRTQLHITSSLQPVDVDRQLLTAAVESLWQAFSMVVKGSSEIVCRASKTPKGIRISLDSRSAQLDDVHISRANADSTQPIAAFAGPAADFLTAQQLCQLFGAKISKTSHSIGMTLPISKQLQMV